MICNGDKIIIKNTCNNCDCCCSNSIIRIIEKINIPFQGTYYTFAIMGSKNTCNHTNSTFCSFDRKIDYRKIINVL